MCPVRPPTTEDIINANRTLTLHKHRTQSKITDMIIKINEIVNKYSLKICLVGHSGDGNLHPQIVLDLTNEENFRDYTKAKAEMYEETIRLGGTISAEHGIGLEKKDYLKYCIDTSAMEYMKIIKKVFDPKNILNPGKIFNL